MLKWSMVFSAALVVVASMCFHSCAGSSSDSRPVVQLTGKAV